MARTVRDILQDQESAREKRLDRIESKLDDIMLNHLPHIWRDISRLKVEVRYQLVIASIILSASVAAVVRLFLGS